MTHPFPNYDYLPLLQTVVSTEQHYALGSAVRSQGRLNADHPERSVYTHIWKPHDAIEIRLSGYFNGYGVLHGDLEIRVRSNKRVDKSNVTWYRGMLMAKQQCSSIYAEHKFIANAAIKSIDIAWNHYSRTMQASRLPKLAD